MTMFARSWEISGREEKLMVRSEGREVGEEMDSGTHMSGTTLPRNTDNLSVQQKK